jgi:hypothetical protein
VSKKYQSKERKSNDKFEVLTQSRNVRFFAR